MNKKVIYFAATVFGSVGSLLGSLIDRSGGFFGIWGIFGGLLGGILGIYFAYKIQQ